MKRDLLNREDIRVLDLLGICKKYFGAPVIIGIHHIFETPRGSDSVITIKEDGLFAKSCQIEIVKNALERLAD